VTTKPFSYNTATKRTDGQNCYINIARQYTEAWYKNLAVANRSRVSCAHNTLRALFIGPTIAPWPWNLG